MKEDDVTLSSIDDKAVVDIPDADSKGLSVEPENTTGITSPVKCVEQPDIRHEDETPAVNEAFHVTEDVSDVTAAASDRTPAAKPSKSISSLIDFFNNNSTQSSKSMTVHQNSETMTTRHHNPRLSVEKQVELSSPPKLSNTSRFCFTKKEEESPWYSLMMATTPSMSLTPLFRVGFILGLLLSGSAHHGPANKV